MKKLQFSNFTVISLLNPAVIRVINKLELVNSVSNSKYHNKFFDMFLGI